MKPVRKAVFPVGGLGTRFLPATKAIPKEMLPVVDKPLIQYAVDEAREAGIEQMIFVTGRGKSAIEDHFDIAYELETVMADRGKPLDAIELAVERDKFFSADEAKEFGLVDEVFDKRPMVEGAKGDGKDGKTD